MAYSFDNMEIWILQELLDRYERSSLFRDRNQPSAGSDAGKNQGLLPNQRRSGVRRIQFRVNSFGKLNVLLEDADRRKEFLRAAGDLKSRGLIDYEWVKYEKGNLIERIWLITEEDRLLESYRICRRVGKEQQILQLEKQIRSALDRLDIEAGAQKHGCREESADDIQAFLKEMLQSVREHHSVPRFFFHGKNTLRSTQCSYEKNESLLRFLVVLSQNKGELQERVVSTRLYGDSKYFERELKTKVVSILRYIYASRRELNIVSEQRKREAAVFETEGGAAGTPPAFLKQETELPEEKSSEELLEERGIVRWPEILEFCGKIQMTLDNGQEISYQNQIFGAYVNSDTVRHATCVKMGEVARVITIENKANYVWYITTHRKEDELVLFHGGVFSPVKGQWLKLIAKAGEETERSISYRHWSDIDVGGFRIFLRLKKEIFPEVLPMSMDVKTLERWREKCMHIDDERYIALIRKMRENPDYEMFHDVLDYMTVHRVRLEQENEI